MGNASINQLLIYRFGQIGDTIVALPSLWLLRSQFPQARFTLLSEVPQGGDALPPERVLPGEGLIQEFLKYHGGSTGGRLWSMLRTAWLLRQSRFDAVAYLLPTIRTARQRARDAWFFRMAGIKNTFGFDGFPENPLPRAADGSLSPVDHEADALLKRLAKSGLSEVKPGEGSMDLRITAEEQSRADAWWSRHCGEARAPHGWFALCAGSKWSSKQWPAERYAEVGRLLIEKHGLLPVILGGNEDRELGLRLISGWGTGLCAAGELAVRESAALLRRARFYLGNDTGVMHLAAAVGRPCVGIFSALDWPGRWHPYGPGHEVLRHEVPCAGCLLKQCPFANECLTGIDVMRVHEACETVLARTSSALRL
ncbi:glycosyltransferase family 9 protein [Prosthecobacter sp.]|uniref:glycosyltransferase family 9 protein n=1 Tax=Prosthecobacter sp. TaxID=1965333 RepID=UPI001D6380D8|nr:glycosyltransferase family 9 protein [Prosthecobacter sp.]MCB1275575.1 glycosyltransferase family 9 protein [Prosthecobacter sp.]